MKCPDCGASIKGDSAFCNYCGAKLDDGVKRSEMTVNINKRIEDVAEIRRAGYEEKESAIRQKKEMRELNRHKARRITCLVLLAIWAVFTIVLFTGRKFPGGMIAFYLIFGIAGGVFLLGYVVYLLITGKW